MSKERSTWLKRLVRRFSRRYSGPLQIPGSMTIWLTGLSGSGKTTLGKAVVKALRAEGHPAALLDGDEVRTTLCSDLGYDRLDRDENVRRVTEVARILNRSGVTAVVALMSPFRRTREQARQRFPADHFMEVYLQATVETCAARDPKGIYRRYDKGDIKHLPGVDMPYEYPISPDLTVDTENVELLDCVDAILQVASALRARAVRS